MGTALATSLPLSSAAHGDFQHMNGYSGPSWLHPSAEQQAQLERYNGSGFSSEIRGDLFFRQFPVEQRFFSTRRHEAFRCVERASALPRPSSTCRDGAEKKFHCRLHAEGRPCSMWSIGSNGQTCFEEDWHSQMPSCVIRVFDPTLRKSAQDKLQRLQSEGVLQFHPVGLSARRGTGVVKGGVAQGRAETLTLFEMMAHWNTSWIDYLKIDCESCEFKAVMQFLDQAASERGVVPVTQLQMEVHLPGRGLSHTRAWAKHGINHTDPVWPKYRKFNKLALQMFSKLLQSGFVVFHIELGGAHPFQCCGAEYSLVNTRAFHRFK